MSTRSLNKVFLIGNLTKDPVLRETSKGTSVATVDVATNRAYKNSSGVQQEDAEFTKVVAWGKLAEIFDQLLQKGTKVFIEGRLKTNSWDDENGVRNYRTEVVVSDMFILAKGKPTNGTRESEEGSSDSQEASNSTSEDEDIDFSNYTE